MANPKRAVGKGRQDKVVTSDNGGHVNENNPDELRRGDRVRKPTRKVTESVNAGPKRPFSKPRYAGSNTVAVRQPQVQEMPVPTASTSRQLCAVCGAASGNETEDERPPLEVSLSTPEPTPPMADAVQAELHNFCSNDEESPKQKNYIWSGILVIVPSIVLAACLGVMLILAHDALLKIYG